jgi:hypothetical protein
MTGPTFPHGHPPGRFDPANAAIGAGVVAAFVTVLGFGVIVFVAAVTPSDEGATIGGAILATAGSLLGVALGSLFTARRARRRGGQPMIEGLAAGIAGFVVVAVAATVVAAAFLGVTLGRSPFTIVVEALNLLTLLPLVAAAAAGGAALGSLGPRSPAAQP